MNVQQVDEPNGTSGLGRANLVSPLKWLASLTAVLILIQAFLAGRGLYLDFDLIETHGIVGNLTFLAVVAQLVLTWAVGIPGSLGKRLLALGAVLTILVVVQIGLGYEGRDSQQAAAWHIPNGILVFGITVAFLALVHQVRNE